LSTGPGFWNRPELRLYVTHARWKNVTGDVVTGSPAFAGKESGTSYGAQVEMWF
jgi:maltoporin